MDYLDGLNNEQMQAVLQTDGPLLILAGAGSGKTRVLTHRIVYMINDCYIRPSNILAITFTKKAAAEMKERVNKLLGNISVNMWIGTFHSCCARILRMDIERLGYDRNFIIYDEADAIAVIKDAMKALNISEKEMTPRSVKEVISRAKDKMESDSSFERKYANDYRYSKISRIYKLYQNTLRKNNALDFDDIIFQTVKLLEDNEDLLEKYRDKFKYIMVDEYQDTNVTQYKLVSMLAKEHLNICVVGDDDQSIYSFRGADITNILNFEHEFPDATVIRLERNYRSTGNILDSANAVIGNNKVRKGKALWTQNGQGEKVCRYEGDNEHVEAAFIVSEMNRLVDSGKYKYSDMAVLYRMNTLSRMMEENLMKTSIPYRIIGGHKFYDRKEIKDIIAYLKLLENPSDDYALKRVINVPKRGIGDVTFENIRAIAFEKGISAFDVITNANLYPALARSSAKLKNFADIMERIARNKETASLSEIIRSIYNETKMVRELEEENTDEARGRIANLEEFVSVAVEFSEHYEPDIDDDFDEDKTILIAFLESVALVSDLDSETGEEDYVLLMTMHSAKGLEFPVVFLVGFEEGIFPGSRSMDTEADMEEERRICYVAITRAKEKLYITNAAQRMTFGATQYARPSRFIRELPPETVDDLNEQYRSTARTRRNVEFVNDKAAAQNRASTRGAVSYQKPAGNMTAPVFGKRINNANDVNSSFLASLAKNKDVKLTTGDRVKHKKFGDGVVSDVSGSGKDSKIEVIFDDAGMKRFMAEFANLTKI